MGSGPRSLFFVSLGLWGILGVSLAQVDSQSVDDSLENAQIRRTTQWAALLPGSGQLLNGKYWKAPIVWGGMAWCISAIDFNQRELASARSTLIEIELADPAAIVNYQATLQSARSAEAFYRRQRDLSWFALIGVHALGVLDAHVDANLRTFDISEDLSLSWTSLTQPGGHFPWTPGLVIRWDVGAQNFTNLTHRGLNRKPTHRNERWN